MVLRKIATIGYTKKTLRHFVELLREAEVTKVIDVRRHNTSQLAGFSKKDDLNFILGLLGIKYEYLPQLAPTEEMLEKFRSNKNWDEYQMAYQELLKEENVLSLLSPSFEGHETICLLCTEEAPDQCHRRLLAGYLSRQLPEAEIIHLR